VRAPEAAPRFAHGYNLEQGRRVDTFAGADLLGVPTRRLPAAWHAFTDTLFGGRILQPSTLAMMMPGPNGSYGLGTYRMGFDGHHWQGSDGFYNGFTTVTMYDFSRKLTVTVLTNFTDNADPAFPIWYRMAAAYGRLTGQ
jgi:hypothetical protein